MNLQKRPILAVRSSRFGMLPAFLELAHRHFEKEVPKEIKGLGTVAGSKHTFMMPIDLLRQMGVPETLLEDLDSIELTYETR